MPNHASEIVSAQCALVRTIGRDRLTTPECPAA